jgi:hypothetical protein
MNKDLRIVWMRKKLAKQIIEYEAVGQRPRPDGLVGRWIPSAIAFYSDSAGGIFAGDPGTSRLDGEDSELSYAA